MPCAGAAPVFYVPQTFDRGYESRGALNADRGVCEAAKVFASVISIGLAPGMRLRRFRSSWAWSWLWLVAGSWMAYPVLAASSDSRGLSGPRASSGAASVYDASSAGALRSVVNVHVERLRGERALVSLRLDGVQRRFFLEPNRLLLAPDVEFWRDGRRVEAVGRAVALRGWFEGDADSWVRGRITKAGVDGLLYVDGALLTIEPKGGGQHRVAEFSGWLDGLPVPGAARCGVSQRLFVSPGEETHALGPDECTALRMAVVASHTYSEKLGDAAKAEEEMIHRINLSDGLYRASLNYGLIVDEVISYSEAGGPEFNAADLDINDELDALTTWKSREYPELGLVHLFSGRTMSGTLGLAWVGATCQASYGSGVSNYLGTGSASTIVVAHEIGHNFGANHDQSGSEFIMSPSVNGSATEFSPSSASMIHNHVQSVGCFEPCDDDSGGDDTETGSESTDTGESTDDTTDDTGETSDETTESDDSSSSDDTGTTESSSTEGDDESDTSSSSEEDEGSTEADTESDGEDDGDGDGDGDTEDAGSGESGVTTIGSSSESSDGTSEDGGDDATTSQTTESTSWGSAGAGDGTNATGAGMEGVPGDAGSGESSGAGVEAPDYLFGCAATGAGGDGERGGFVGSVLLRLVLR